MSPIQYSVSASALASTITDGFFKQLQVWSFTANWLMGMSRLRPWKVTWSNETFKFFNVSSSPMAQILYWSKNNGMLECDSSHHLVSGRRKVYFIFNGGKVGFMGEGLLARKAREIWRYLLRGQKFGWFKKPLAIQTMGTSHITCYKTCVDFPSSGLTNVEFSSEVGLLLFTKRVCLLSWSQRPSLC